MSSPIVSFVLVGMNAEAASVARDAVRLYFPHAETAEAASVESAMGRPEKPGAEILLLCNPAFEDAAKAVAATDARWLPRWGVVLFAPGPACGRAVILPPEDWNALRAERAFRAAAALHTLARENARLRGDLATIGRRFSHDLRTPLMGITTACEAINETPPQDTVSIRELTQSIAHGSDEIARLIERFGSVVKASADPAAKEPVSMKEVVWATLQRLERRVLKKGAAVVQPESWPPVNGVATWLETVWLNFIANALEHGGPAPRIELGWTREPGAIRFWVEDGGPGVSEAAGRSLFHSFDLLHRSNAPRGLGLPIVRRLMDLQGGTCGHEPRAGGGARFFFTLPA